MYVHICTYMNGWNSYGKCIYIYIPMDPMVEVPIISIQDSIPR